MAGIPVGREPSKPDAPPTDRPSIVHARIRTHSDMNSQRPAEHLEAGSLYVVATPIGHLDDLSPRAAETLRQVQFVAAEDTRVTRTLLTRVGSGARLLSAHQHNESEAAHRIVEMLRSGASVALVSDAGTPAISDPGTVVVSAVLAAGLRAIPVPGPSALTAMLSACGLAQGGFVFDGFLPQRAGPRERRLRELEALGKTVVLFEAPHRIAATCAAIAEVFGESRKVALGRELTKHFEEIATIPASELLAWLAEHPGRAKGEYVIVISAPAPTTPCQAEPDGGPAMPPATLTLQTERLLRELLPELGARKASRLVERLAELPSGSLYRKATELQAG
jgi:16S rRNA (cytidine1402-2'-O)-methyltransferase